MRWQVNASRAVYDSPWVRVRLDDVTLPSGKRIDHHVLEFPNRSVGVIVTDVDGRLLLIWRHRHITDSSGWEFPAGWADPGEDLRMAAAREVQEETGYAPDHLNHLMIYHPLSGISTMTYTVFHAIGATKKGNPEIDETDRVAWFAPEEVRTLLRKQQITDGPSLTAISFYLATQP